MGMKVSSFKDVAASMLPGDVIAFGGESVLANLIRLAGGSPVSHAAIVVEAANGAEALQLLKKQDCECDLLITDYAMPHLSGTEFLRAARELCPNVPALIITGYAELDAISDPPEGVGILLKPFTPTLLEAAIHRVCCAEQAAN